MVKNYIIDTNVPMHDPNFILNFEDNNVILPLVCLEELDHLKIREGLQGFHAREAIRNINRYRLEDTPLSEGVELETGGMFKVETNHMDMSVLPNAMDKDKNDNKILAVALNMSKVSEQETILVTKDISMAIKADSLGIKVQDYESDKINTDFLYKGFSEIMLTSKEIDGIYNGGIELPDTDEPVYPNHFFMITDLTNPNHKVLARFNGEKIVPLKYDKEQAWGLKPINLEQKMAFELLMDPDVHLVTITGGAGSGKTILSTSVALKKVLESGVYRKVIFVRPVVPAGHDIGFLPGTEEEKLKPWMGSFYDAIDSLYNDKKRKAESVDEFIEKYRKLGVIETKTFNYMRGRTLAGALVIIDEAQQMTPHLAKLMLTRAGKETKFIMIGDPSDNQIDNVMVDKKSNGLVYTVDKMKPFDITGHITLKQVERSPLAELAERYL